MVSGVNVAGLQEAREWDGPELKEVIGRLEQEFQARERTERYISVHDPAALTRRVSEGFTDSLADASGWYAAESRTVI